MTAPCTGPHIRAQSIGGPACRIVRPARAAITSRAGRTSTSIGRAPTIRATARLVGHAHACADRVVGIVLEARHEEPELTIAARRRPPVELRDRGAVGARRLGERCEADVEGMDAVAEDGGGAPGRRHGRALPTVSGAGHDHREAGGGGIAGRQQHAGGGEPGLLIVACLAGRRSSRTPSR